MIQLGPALGGSSLLPCLATCASAAGRPREAPVLAGLVGHPFETSYALGGAELWSCCALEWGSFRWADRLGLRQEVFDLVSNNPRLRPRPTAEERERLLAAAFESIARSTERGVPVLLWSPMSAAQKEGGLAAFCWGVVEGVDRGRREYLVVHRDAGRFRTPAGELGQVDAVHWFHARVFLGPDPWHHEDQSLRAALADGAGLLSGEIVGADAPAPAARIRHGTAALRAWADEVEAGSRSPGRARFWSNARTEAAAFCRFAAGLLPRARQPLEAAASALSAQAGAFGTLASGPPDAELIRKAAALQEEAAASLRRAT